MKNKMSFASDNFAGVHPDILRSIGDANKGHEKAYGYDQYTKRFNEMLKSIFEQDIDAYLVFTGTAANVLSIRCLIDTFDAVICTDSAHMNVYEGGAPEMYTGNKLIDLPSHDGKINIEDIKPYLHFQGDEHHVQPRLISITQSTELGTVYKPEEIKEIADFAHANNMKLHMDGARIYNAAASLNVSLKAITSDVGVDVLSLGGTKNGMMIGEAIVFFDPSMSKKFKLIRKQGMNLFSKMRFFAAQYEALFTNDLWLKNARNANQMAKYLVEQIKDIKEIEIINKVESNAIFVRIPAHIIEKLQQEFFFYIRDADESIVRWMTSFDTRKEHIDEFVREIKRILNY
ncbi:threonine aldolase family protein [Bacteroidota bacterium]